MPPKKWHIPDPSPKTGAGFRQCLRQFVERNDPGKLDTHEYTFHQFAQLCGRSQPDDDVIRVAGYLVSIGVFKVAYLFRDEDGSFDGPIAPETVKEATAAGSFVHPRTGAELHEFAERLFPILSLKSSTAYAEH